MRADLWSPREEALGFVTFLPVPRVRRIARCNRIGDGGQLQTAPTPPYEVGAIPRHRARALTLVQRGCSRVPRVDFATITHRTIDPACPSFLDFHSL